MTCTSVAGIILYFCGLFFKFNYGLSGNNFLNFSIICYRKGNYKFGAFTFNACRTYRTLHQFNILFYKCEADTCSFLVWIIAIFNPVKPDEHFVQLIFRNADGGSYET